jgi:hypothetical protein
LGTAAEAINVQKNTAISWENGAGKPSGAALRLLTVTRLNRHSYSGLKKERNQESRKGFQRR